jgi:hypothetical protein
MKPSVKVMGLPSIVGVRRVSNRPIADSTRRRGQRIDDKPKSVYEILTRQMLEELKDDLAEVKGRINTLLWLVVGAVLLELVARIIE